MKCISCGLEFIKGVSFFCPNCKEKISRCLKCKKIGIEYKCKCGFTGP